MPEIGKRVRPTDLRATNAPSDTLVPSYDALSGLFKWIAGGGGPPAVHDKTYHTSPTLPDNDAHKTATPIDHPDASITPAKLEVTNSPSDTQVPSYDALSGLFKWIPIKTSLFYDYVDGAFVESDGGPYQGNHELHPGDFIIFELSFHLDVESICQGLIFITASTDYPDPPYVYVRLGYDEDINHFGYLAWIPVAGFYLADLSPNHSVILAPGDHTLTVIGHVNSGVYFYHTIKLSVLVIPT